MDDHCATSTDRHFARCHLRVQFQRACVRQEHTVATCRQISRGHIGAHIDVLRRVDNQRIRVDLRLTKDRARLTRTGFHQSTVQLWVRRNGGLFRAEVDDLFGRGGGAVGTGGGCSDGHIVGHSDCVVVILGQLVGPATIGLNSGRHIAARNRDGHRRIWCNIATCVCASVQISQRQDIVATQAAHCQIRSCCTDHQIRIGGGITDIARTIHGLGKDSVGAIRQHGRRCDLPYANRCCRGIARCAYGDSLTQ